MSDDGVHASIRRPLAGITVVAVEQAVAAPFATRHLADLGARVLKIERPAGGDFARDYDHVVDGLSSHFVWLNRSKESVVLDLKHGAGRHALDRLIGSADVFVQNLAPGTAERLGFGAAQLRERHPRLVHCSISGYGADGPFSAKKAYDLLIQCEAGLVSMTGTPDAPAKAGIPVADISAGMYAYSSILAALLRRASTGAGATIEVSMLEALTEWMGFPLYYSMYAHEQPPRSGAAHPVIAPYGPVRCRDGVTIFFGVQNEREWSVLCREVLRSPGLATDETFSTNVLRVRHRPALDAAIDAVVCELDGSDLERRLQAAGIASARVRDLAGLAAHPQLDARERWRLVDSPVGRLRALLPPAQVDDLESVFGAVPELGQHTEAVMREFGLLASSP